MSETPLLKLGGGHLCPLDQTFLLSCFPKALRPQASLQHPPPQFAAGSRFPWANAGLPSSLHRLPSSLHRRMPHACLVDAHPGGCGDVGTGGASASLTTRRPQSWSSCACQGARRMPFRAFSETTPPSPAQDVKLWPFAMGQESISQNF